MAKDNARSESARRFRLQMCDPEYPNDNRVVVWRVSEIHCYPGYGIAMADNTTI